MLREAGVQSVLSSFVTGADWQAAFEARGYESLTLYLSRSALGDAGRASDVRPARKADVPGIVARSVNHR